MKALLALAAFALGAMTMFVFQPASLSASQPVQELRPTAELLGTIAVDMGPGSPNHELFEEARKDDRLRDLAKRDAWK